MFLNQLLKQTRQRWPQNRLTAPVAIKAFLDCAAMAGVVLLAGGLLLLVGQ